MTLRNCAVCLSLTGLLSLSGCLTPVVPSPILLTQENDNSTQVLVPSQQIILSLPDISASTGFVWAVVENNPEFLSVTDIVSPTTEPGAPGTAVFTFTALQAQPTASAPIEVELEQIGPADQRGSTFSMLVFINN